MFYCNRMIINVMQNCAYAGTPPKKHISTYPPKKIGSNGKAGWNVAGRKHKKVKQALGVSLRNLFEQLAWRTSPAAVRA